MNKKIYQVRKNNASQPGEQFNESIETNTEMTDDGINNKQLL